MSAKVIPYSGRNCRLKLVKGESAEEPKGFY